MVNPDVIFGRLGNRLFQCAFLYAKARELETDFYFQDPAYFEKYEAEIKELFGDGIGFLDQIGVHVRRAGNPINPSEPKYSENPFYVDLVATDYYEQAMALFPGEKFVIFSDDPEYCKQKFQGENIQVMDMGDEIEDFNILASCKGIIGANSTWSWWAAFLCPTPNAKIVFPSPNNWYKDGLERTKCPKSWVRI